MKRPRELYEPADFLRYYFQLRQVNVIKDECADERDIRARAELARERFRTFQAQPLRTAAACTSADKYNRRLLGNRVSASASRVYHEVVRRETTYAHRSAAERVEYNQSLVAQLDERLGRLDNELKAMHTAAARLENKLQAMNTHAPVRHSPVAINETEALFEQVELPALQLSGGAVLPLFDTENRGTSFGDAEPVFKSRRIESSTSPSMLKSGSEEDAARILGNST